MNINKLKLKMKVTLDVLGMLMQEKFDNNASKFEVIFSYKLHIFNTNQMCL